MEELEGRTIPHSKWKSVFGWLLVVALSLLLVAVVAIEAVPPQILIGVAVASILGVLLYPLTIGRSNRK
jgi:Flp pilus assembly protein TadB